MTLDLDIDFTDVTEFAQRFPGFAAEYDKELLALAKKSGILVQDAWKIVAAVDEGRYRASVTNVVKVLPSKSLVVTIGTNVVSTKGFGYPRALEDSPRYHYRRGPRRGQRTAGQVRKAANAQAKTIAKWVKDMTDKLLEKLARK